MVYERHIHMDGLLTDRQMEVCQLAIKGFDNFTISKIMYISEASVQMHLKHIYRALNLYNVSNGSKRILMVLKILDYNKRMAV